MPDFATLKYQEKIINNLKTYLVKENYNDSFVAGLFINHGANMNEYSIDGKAPISGIAHFIEHRLFDSINGEVLDLGANLGLDANAETSSTYTLYYISGTKNKVMQGLKLLFDMVFYIKRNERGLKKERQIILSEKKENEISFIDQFYQKSYNNFLKGTFLENSTIGSIKDIKKTTYDDLILYHETFYKLANISFIFMGNYSFKKLNDFISNYCFPKQKQHNLVFIPPKIMMKNNSQIYYKDVGFNLFSYALMVHKDIYEKYKAVFYDYLDFFNVCIYNSPYSEEINEKEIFASYMRFDYEITDSYAYLVFEGMNKNRNIKALIDKYFYQNLVDSLDEYVLEAYYKGEYIDVLFKSNDNYKLLETFVNVLDNKKDIKSLLKPKHIDLHKFKHFMQEIYIHSTKYIYCWNKRRKNNEK